jgi:hypothetical protein
MAFGKQKIVGASFTIILPVALKSPFYSWQVAFGSVEVQSFPSHLLKKYLKKGTKTSYY